MFFQINVSAHFSARAALLAAAAICTPVAAIAQNTVVGSVVDENGSPVPGARVVIESTGQVVVTDRQGRFFVPSLPEGEATLNVTYRGLAPASQTVTVSQGASTDITITMAPVAEIVVLGAITDPTVRALNQQKNADATTNVISADSIGRLPDINIAEALQRVPGFGVERDQGEGNFVSIRGAPSKFTAVTVDGVTLRSTDPETRAIDLGTFNSDLVSSIEVFKTLMPFQDADSIAGAINLTTLSAFDKPRFRTKLTGGVGYNELGGTNDYRLGGRVSDVFGDFGIVLSAKINQTDRRVDNFEVDRAAIDLPEGGVGVRPFQLDFKDYETRRQRVTLSGALEYRPGNVSSFFIRGNYNRRTDDEWRDRLTVVLDDGDILPGSDLINASWRRSRLEKEIRHRIVEDRTTVVSAGGKHEWSAARLDYMASYTDSLQTFPIRRQLRFRSTLRPAITIDGSNPNAPEFSIFETGEHLQLDAYNFRQNNFRGRDTKQSEWAFMANLSIPTQMFGAPAEVRMGGKARLADIDTDDEQFRDRRGFAAPELPLADILRDTPSQTFNYNLGQKFDKDFATNYWNRLRPVSQVEETRRVAESTTADFNAKEDIFAGYAMTRIQFPSTNVIVGLRVEHTRFEGGAFTFEQSEVAGEPDIIGFDRIERSYTDFFPNLTVRHEFTPNLIGRFAATRSTARPNFRDVVPRLAASDDDAGRRLDVNLGNPDLRQTVSNNLDAGIEYYFGALGQIAFNVFYKDIENFEFTTFEQGIFTTTSGFERDARFIQQQNAQDAYILGFEASVQTQFTFLPGWFSNFGMFANVAYADAQITLPERMNPDPDAERSLTARMPDQSEWTYNVSLFYENGPFNARIAYTGRSDYIDGFADRNALDLIWVGRDQLDVTAGYDFSKRFSVFVEAKNITDTAGIRYFGERSQTYEFEKFGVLFFAGARVNF